MNVWGSYFYDLNEKFILMNKQLLIPVLIFFGLSLTLSSCGQQETTEQTEQTQENLVNPENFIRAETDNMFAAMVNAAGGTNKFFHFDKLTPLDRQTVIRMNRDVLYSGGVFDAKEGLEIIFPELPDER